MTDTAPPPPPGSPPDQPSSSLPPPGPPPGPSAGPFAGSLSGRTLRRSTSDRKVAGVAGGLGRWLDVDPTILRVLFVVLAFFGGAGLLLYGVVWLIVPEDGADQGAVPTGDSLRNALLIGAVVLAALLALGDSLDGHFFPWPLLVVGLVVAAVLLGRDNRRRDGVPPTAPPPTAAAHPAGDGYGPGVGGATEPTVVLEKQPLQGEPAEQQWLTQPAWYPPVAPPPPPPPRRRGPLLFGPTLALLALGLGVLGLFDATGGAVAAAAYPALALAIIGLLLVVGAFVGRPGGLILLGLVAAFALLVTSVVDPAYSGPRDVELQPTSATMLDDSYHVPTGRIALDLSQVNDPATLDGRSFDLSVGAGEVVVVVPRSVRVEYDAAVDFGGEVDVVGRTADGWSPQLSGSAGPADAEATVQLQLAANFGHLEVVRS